jgi:hypothetical protein
MTSQPCHEAVLRAARELTRATGRNEFTVDEIVNRLRDAGSVFADSTITTNVNSRCRRNAPGNHVVRLDYFEPALASSGRTCS